MANPKITAELMLNLHTQELSRDLEKSLVTGTQKAMREARRTVADAFREATVQALTDGKTGSAMKELHKTGVVEAQQGYLKLQRQIEGLEKRALDEKLTSEEKAQMKRLQEASRNQKNLLDERMRAFKREQDIRRQVAKEQRSAASDAAKGFESAADNLRGVLMGGFGAWAQGARGVGERVQQRGEGRIARAQAMGEQGADPKQVAQMAKLGRTLAGIGTALAAIAGVVGAVVVLVKLFADLESKVKDMNKALIDTAGAADFGMTRADIVSGKLAQRIEQMRNDTTALNNNFMRFRVTFKEQQQILAEFNRAGFTYARMNKEIEEGSSHLKSFSDATALAITYSRTLGVSTGEAAQKMGDLAFETGMGLQDIAEQFSVITREAMQAGFATKRFYSTIVEVTSGMAFYGVRIDETAKLLKTFDSLLGEAVGTEAFQKIVGQYKDKGAQDRIRDLIVKDQEFAQQQFAKAFERQIRQLAKTGDKLGLNEKEIRDLLKMDEVGMSARLQQLGASPEQIQDFRRARMVGQAAQGGIGAMTRAMPFAGPGFDIAMASQATGVFGNRRIDEVLRDLSADELGVAQLAGLQEVTGKSLEELEELAAAFTNMEGKFLNLREIAKIAPSERTAQQLELLAQYAKEGLFLEEETGKILKGEADDQGKLIKGTEIAVSNALDAVTATTTLGEDQIKEQLTRDQEIATEISRNVTGVTEMLEQSTNRILESIYEGVMSIYEWLIRDDTARLADAERQRAAKQQLKELQEQEEALRDEIGKLTAQVAEAGPGKERTRMQQEIAEKESEALGLVQAQTALTASQARLANMTVEERLAAGGGEAGAFLEQSGVRVDKANRVRDVNAAVDEAIGDRFEQNLLFAGDVGAITRDLFGDSLEERVRTQFQETGLYEKLGPQDVDRALETAAAAGRKAREEVGATAGADEWAQAQEEAFRQVLKDALVPLMAKSAGGFVAGAKKAQDLIIPAGGGAPIITDPADTTMAFKPGGAVAQAIGGGAGGGAISINIYGGDQKKVYDTVMRVLKATGNA